MSCECEKKLMNDHPKMKVGYAYVPYQKFGNLYTPEKAIIQGTIFPELDICLGEYERGLYDGK